MSLSAGGTTRIIGRISRAQGDDENGVGNAQAMNERMDRSTPPNQPLAPLRGSFARELAAKREKV
jgi:hypothetical protein